MREPNLYEAVAKVIAFCIAVALMLVILFGLVWLMVQILEAF